MNYPLMSKHWDSENAKIPCHIDKVRKAIFSFDGKSLADLKPIAALEPTRRVLADVIRIAASHDHQVAATWLLNAWAANKHTPEPLDILELYSHPHHWQAQLHLAQMTRHVPDLSKYVQTLYPILKRWLESPAPFVRAWTYDALWHLTEENEKLRDQVLELIVTAADTEKASVQARIRNLIR